MSLSLFQVDVSSSMAVVMAVKEDAELKTIQRASQVTCDVFSKYLKEQIMEVIDADKVKEILILHGFKHYLFHFSYTESQ